ncbi:RnfABCDGE type electron transport complex subunit D [Pseudazoarcus pumilus]|uniref:Ion-translocating oxidoreductase complex subunit D n=1 Tax=Pseudazoarcus pumilus TaxID=2067960 RepID=A0A2I6S6R0_9RHOO|nr:RnfABCDGE type electron transport complex subunit D [Pseudazoarcus pumilus]AUN94944.1 electron transport complex subunit RsxD [Pseudazoarcus pumilus]
MIHSPYIRTGASVHAVMRNVLIALVPGIALYVWQIGAGILVQLAIATVVALAAEALVLRLRARPVGIALTDLSAVVTAWLVALSFPPIVPWWITAFGVLIAIVAVKHLYGGLGQNPFNPAMVGYCAMIVAFPSLMAQWPPAGALDFATQLELILGGVREIDAITGATALDALRTGLRADDATVPLVMQREAFGMVGGRGWEWIGLGYLAGGLWLLARRTITWHMPVAFLGTLTVISALMWLIDPQQFASPLFHLLSGGALLAAFFIVTDPVSGSTTPRGKLIFAAGIAIIAYVIRNWGAFPEGIAFAVLLMNMCVPLIDMKTQPPVFGHKEARRP